MQNAKCKYKSSNLNRVTRVRKLSVLDSDVTTSQVVRYALCILHLNVRVVYPSPLLLVLASSKCKEGGKSKSALDLIDDGGPMKTHV